MRREVVVVGGGPAGSATALELARAGHDVTVLERSRFPRAKPCGESVNVGAVRQLAELGLLEVVRRLPHTEVREWRVTPTRGRSFSGHLDESGIAIDRGVFDAALLDAAGEAGAQVEFDRQVVDLIWESGRVAGVRVRGGETLHSRWVVGADGLRSVVLRRLGLLARRPKLRKVGLTAHVENADVETGLGELRLTEWGCAGIVRIDEHTTNVAIVVAARAAHILSSGPEDAFDALNSSLAGMAGSRRSSDVLATGPFDCPVRRRTAPGALLVGDAAGYYDPFTGQGIFRALRGGRAAAGAISRILSGEASESRMLEEYEQTMHRSVRWQVGLQHVIEAVTSRPRLMAGAASLLALRPELANRLISVTGDASPVSHLIHGTA